MKKYALIALAACLCLASCNRGELNPEPTEDAVSDETVFLNVVGQLVDSRDLTMGYAGKTFKPTIGKPDGGDESVRVVALNSLGAAVSHFNDLTGAGITETTATKSWQHKEVGVLTWHLTHDNTSWATVDVNIPSVPGLHKIIYRSPGQGDVNGHVGDNGSAYYRFGDVLRESDTHRYWICVRPSFGPEGKGDSHWVSVSPLPYENIWPYYKNLNDLQPFKASNEMEYGLPYNIGNQLKWHQDLAELLFAIINPELWEDNVRLYSTESRVLHSPEGLPIFSDFHVSNIKYHNKAFWKNVQAKWKFANIIPFVFGIPYEEMEAALNPYSQNARGLHFLYSGHSWNTLTSNKPKLFQVHYTNGDKDEERNMHKQTTKTVSAQVVVPHNFEESNINYPLDFGGCTTARPFMREARFFGDDAPRWTVMYATGAQLSRTGRFDPQQPIPGFDNANDNEYYRYYSDVYSEKNLTDEPEITDATGDYGFVGAPHYQWGDVYKDEDGCFWFVINQAGNDNEEDADANRRSPYADLVSFDPRGLRTTSANGRASNIPPLNQALRAYMFLAEMTRKSIAEVSDFHLESDKEHGKTVLNIMQNAGVDLRHIMQSVVSRNNNDFSESLICSIAYDSQTAGQSLVRCILNNMDPANPQDDFTPRINFWTKYPQNADAAAQVVTNFSDINICLQDISDQGMVNAKAPDYYAALPLSTRTLSTSNLNVPREVRQQADNRATNVRNYFYDQNSFLNVQYPGSMWNEPVLFFRYTRIKDQGNDGYATKTVDGHTLTLVSARDDDFDKDYAHGIWKNNITINLNGEMYRPYGWRAIDNSDINSK